MLKSAVIVLLIAAAAFWFAIFGPNAAVITLGSFGPWGLAIFGLIVACIARTPPTATLTQRLINRLNCPSPRTRLINSLVVALCVFVYLYLTARAEHRQFFPYIHDEFSYLIQAHQLAHHRLWMPGHPLASFFDSFQLFTKPVYASAYFPGTAITYLPGIWLHWQPMMTSLIVSGLVAGVLYWIATEVLDGVAGWLAVLLLLSDGLYRQISIMTLGEMPLLLSGLLATVAWLRWRATNRSDWAIGIGFFLGLAAVTRPVDSLCFAIPIGMAALIRCTKSKSFAAIAGVAAGLIPFLFLQLLLNRGITGDWLRTPFGLYADREYPGSGYGFHAYAPGARPESNLPQMQLLYDAYRPLIKSHQPENVLADLMRERLRYAVSQLSPGAFPVLILLLPLSLLGLGLGNRSGGRSIAIVLAALPLFLLLYSGYFLFLPSYVLPVAPAVILGILVGAKVLANAWPSARRFATVGLSLFIAGTSLAALPNWSNVNPEDIFAADLLTSVNQQLAALAHHPAVVLFTFDPHRDLHQEPVYNADVAWPDDADVIRAHDRGPLNFEIFRYYADCQPGRFFYRYDERDKSLHELGSAKELAAQTQPHFR